jgi:hypothetical protein
MLLLNNHKLNGKATCHHRSPAKSDYSQVLGFLKSKINNEMVFSQLIALCCRKHIDVFFRIWTKRGRHMFEIDFTQWKASLKFNCLFVVRVFIELFFAQEVI